ncbi:MAG: hypothetical protein ABF313_15830, partial [Marivita sp.]
GSGLVEEVLAIGRNAVHDGGFERSEQPINERVPTRDMASAPIASNADQTASITIPLRLEISIGALDRPPFSTSS